MRGWKDSRVKMGSIMDQEGEVREVRRVKAVLSSFFRYVESEPDEEQTHDTHRWVK